MFQSKFNRAALTDPSWWHWTLTVPLLAASLTGEKWAIGVAMVLCIVAGSYFFYRIREIRPYPVQVRIAYFGLLILGTFPGQQWIHWVQFFGTSAMVTAGYCPLIRMLSLLPWNQNESMSFTLVWHAFVTEPCSGGLIGRQSETSHPSMACCSLPTAPTTIACSLENYQPTSQEINHAQAR